jgi:hypothetical protein
MNIITGVTMDTIADTVMAIVPSGLIRTLLSWVRPLWSHHLPHLRCRLHRHRHPRFHPFMDYLLRHLPLTITGILSSYQLGTTFLPICFPYLQTVICHLSSHFLSPCPPLLTATLPKHPYRNSDGASGPCPPPLY